MTALRQRERDAVYRAAMRFAKSAQAYRDAPQGAARKPARIADRDETALLRACARATKGQRKAA